MLVAILGLNVPSAPVLHGCLAANTTGLPFCNTALSFSVRAVDLRQRLTLSEKLCLLNASPNNHKTDNCSGAVPRLGLPAYNWAIEDLHGAGTECLSSTNANGTTSWHCPTIFPTLNVLAASFNDSLWQRVGEVIGREVRAANNAGAKRARNPPGIARGNPYIGVSAWGPNLNIARDPRWGRLEE